MNFTAFLLAILPVLSGIMLVVEKSMPDFGKDDYTLSLWIRTDEDGSIFSVCAEDAPWETGGKSLFIAEGKLHFDIGWVGVIRGSKAVTDGNWHHVAFSGAQPQRIYVDGRLDVSGMMRKIPDSDTFVLKFGTTCEDFPEQSRIAFVGELDEVMLFKRRLSVNEILRLSREGAPEGLRPMGRWSFEKTLDDASGDHAARRVGDVVFTEGKFSTAVRLDGKGHLVVRYARPPCPERARILEYAASYEEKTFRESDLLGTPPFQGFSKLLFVQRRTYHSSHFYTDFIDGCSRYGGNLCVLDLKTGGVIHLVPEMEEGIFGRFDLDFDARKVVFDWKASPKEGFRLFEIGIDPSSGKRTSGPKQLTFPPEDEPARIAKYDNSFIKGTARMYYHQTDDMHPCWLPDGGVAFTSTRCEYGTLCDAPDALSTAVLHRMDAEGLAIQKLTNSAVSEFSPSVMEDGRVLYTRWEYVDKGQLGVKCLWAMHPNGSGSVEIYGNDITFPPSFLHGRQIPGEKNLFVFLGTPHYPQSGIGTVIRADMNRDIRTREPMTYITPHVDIRQEPGWNHHEDGRWTKHERGPLYMDPFPLSRDVFLVAHNRDRPWDDPVAYGLYVIDASGTHRLIHAEEDTSCWQPVPLRTRKRPPHLPDTHDPELAKKGLAVCLVQDIHHGMEGVEPGEVKFLRVMEQVPRPWDARRFWDPYNRKNGHTNLVSKHTALATKVMWGIVPVEEDGSAHFYTPADRNIYLQALDENYMELQRERTYVNFRPGERRSCVGCHDKPNETPLQGKRFPMAMRKEPVMPGPQPGDTDGRQVIHFPSYVQPVLDRHCIACHDAESELDLTGELTTFFSRSYENLMDRGAAPTFREDSDWEGTPYAPPRSIGSHVSPLVEALLHGEQHEDLDLPREDFIRILTWIDASGVYYGSYWGRRHIEYRGPSLLPARAHLRGGDLHGVSGAGERAVTILRDRFLVGPDSGGYSSVRRRMPFMKICISCVEEVLARAEGRRKNRADAKRPPGLSEKKIRE